MKRPPATGSVALEIYISPSDIESMLDAYDSGMCDTSTANCLSRALTRVLNRSRTIPLIRNHGRDGYLDLGGTRIPVPGEILAWLEEAEIGARCRPMRCRLDLPVELVPRHLREEVILPVAVTF